MVNKSKKIKQRILRGRAYNEEDSKEEVITKPPLAVRHGSFAVSSAKSRKELRKEQRKAKKAQKHQYLLAKVGREDLVKQAAEALVAGKKKKKKRKKRNKKKKGNGTGNEEDGGQKESDGKKGKVKEEQAQSGGESGEDSEDEEDEVEKFVREAVRNKVEGRETVDMAEELKVDKEKMRKGLDEVRRKRLVEDNEEEERTINQLSKKLKLNKKATIPASFRTDGLDFLLEVCEKGNKKKKSEDDSSGSDDEDMDGAVHNEIGSTGDMDEEESDVGSAFDVEDDDDTDLEAEEEDDLSDESHEDEADLDAEVFGSNDGDLDEDGDENELESENDVILNDDDFDKGIKKKQEKDKKKAVKENQNEKEGDEVWEDIYGRLRSKDGSVLSNTTSDKTTTSAAAPTGKYVPPAMRGNQSSREKLMKQLKGLLNRLSESNMHSIATQVEEMYMTNSRNEMNQTLLELLSAALIRHSLMPERVMLEHVMLIAILHANVGTEVGAYFTQSFVQEFKSKYDSWNESSNEEDKHLENLLLIIAFIYHFKIIDACLIYDMLKFLSDSFKPKDVELILTVLRSIGFRLRKDDPAALKGLILTLQQKASKLQSGASGSAKVKFMLEILMAIRNNNMNKIPNYDPSFGEHLSKILKSHLHPGNYVSELKIGLQDLLNADKAGRWWIVGSAWAGKQADGQPGDIGTSPNTPITSEDAIKHAKLLKRARAQGMNTDTRRNVFCILMTAEDYMDAFEKLNHLGLRNNQDREIMHVAVYCCLQEKQYNPYYGLIVSKFCEMDRKLMLALQFNLWDRLKDLDGLTSQQRTNLALLLVHLINDKSLPVSTLKVIEFAEMDKVKLKFLKKVLTGVLMQNEVENLQEIFVKPAMSEKLGLFRESLRLFLSHFMLQSTITTTDGSIVQSKLSPTELKALKERVKIAEKCMSLGKGGLVAGS